MGNIDNPLRLSDPITLESEWGPMEVIHASSDGVEGLIVRFDEPLGAIEEPVLARVQSSCIFSESLGSVDCDCNLQLKKSIELAAKGAGLVIYVLEEGRGVGLARKVEAIRLQQTANVDTAVAFQSLGVDPDPRDHRFAARVLQHFVGSRPINLLTNNPHKIMQLRSQGINVAYHTTLLVGESETVQRYRREKSRALGHILDE